jgi:hypothetical protein
MMRPSSWTPKRRRPFPARAHVGKQSSIVAKRGVERTGCVHPHHDRLNTLAGVRLPRDEDLAVVPLNSYSAGNVIHAAGVNDQLAITAPKPLIDTAVGIEPHKAVIPDEI